MPEDANKQDEKPEGDAKKEEPKSEAKGKPKDDLGALRASLNTQIDGLRGQLTAREAEVADFRAKEAEIAAKLEAANLTDDPEKLAQRVVALSGENAQLKQRAEHWGQKGLDYAAEAKAAQILLGQSTEHLGSLVQRLKSANTESDMEAIAASIRSELETLSNLAPPKEDEIPDDIDSGAPSAGAKSVIAQIRGTGTDPYNPEHQKAWAEKREAIRARTQKGS